MSSWEKWHPPQALSVGPEWAALSEGQRESVHSWLREFGVDPVTTIGYVVEGDGLTVIEFCPEFGGPHRRRLHGGSSQELCTVTARY